MRLSQHLLAALPSLALAVPTQHHDARTDSVEWKSCRIAGSVPGDCGKLKVPLDYTDDECNKQLTLDIYRVPATNTPKKGSIFLNFGGPGANGVADLAAFAPNLVAATGGYHDLINVVPRGTNGTLTFSCFDNPVSRTVGTSITVGNASDVATGELWARAKIFDDTCAVAQNETGRFIGTAFTARDHMRVADALGEDGMLRYWGFSYGSLLGSTLVAMFPDKVDKVILDGVVNPFEYYQNIESELVTSVDDVFKGFCKGCVAKPEACPLAGNLTAEQLEEFLYTTLDDLKANPIPVVDPAMPGGGTLLDYSFVKAYFLRQLNFPSQWPSVAKMLAGAAAGGAEDTPSSEGQGADESQLGIKCSDVLKHTNNLTDLLPVYETRRKLSRFGGDTIDQVIAQCAQWKLPAKERYDGDFKIKTKNPVLIINNRHDPVTPIVSARNVSKTLEGSVLLEQNSYGHDSMARGSVCTAKAIRSYFNDGELPKRGTVCEDTKIPLFAGESGWDQVIKELSGNSTAN